MNVLVCVAVFAISFVIQFLVIRLFGRKMLCMDNDFEKVHRFHSKPTTRAGGVGIFAAFIAGLLLFEHLLPGDELRVAGTPWFLIVFSALPVFLAGFLEDLKGNMDVKIRLAATMFSSIVSIALLGLVVSDLAVVRLPYLLAVPFTIFAITGMTNAVNIIDGFNGLASGFSLIALSLIAVVAYIHGDYMVLMFAMVVVAAVLGFFVWNFPGGRIFLGDGGAYFLGFMLAMIAIMLVTRNPEVSPWFPVALFVYPVYEVLFSSYRKKVKRRGSAFVPDKAHFHMLIHNRVTRSNPKTSCYIWGLVILFSPFTLIYHRQTAPLMLITVFFVLTYTLLYRKIVKFKVWTPRLQSGPYFPKINKTLSGFPKLFKHAEE